MSTVEMNAYLLNWFRHEQTKQRQQIDLMTSGKMKTGKKEVTGPWVDATAEELERVQRKLAELDKIIARLEGSAITPDAV